MFDAIKVDHTRRTIRPTTQQAEIFFGVAPLTNGTAPKTRRSMLGLEGYRWLCTDGREAAWVSWYQSSAPVQFEEFDGEETPLEQWTAQDQKRAEQQNEVEKEIERLEALAESEGFESSGLAVPFWGSKNGEV